jgi:ergothioneine biosynthesis protein EgtB
MLAERYRAVRAMTMALAAPLSDEDCTVQSMPDASPAKWHLAHTTWFFETFVLAKALSTFRPFESSYAYLFNSYYEAVGARHPRPQRGMITRPTMNEIRRYREYVDAAMAELLARWDAQGLDEAAAVGAKDAPETPAFAAILGLHHEQQHQELLLTDILHAFSRNPLRPAYVRPEMRAGDDAHARRAATAEARTPSDRAAIDRGAQPRTSAPSHPYGEGLRSIGHAASSAFAFDNEGPRHRTFLESFSLGSRLVTNGEYRDFILDGGYRRPELWLSDGWATAQSEGWTAPLYWEEPVTSGTLDTFSLRGLGPADLSAPVSHVSFYEADAYARWAGARLPMEAEWEVAAATAPVAGNFVESQRFATARYEGSHDGPAQLFGDVWEWTCSPYVAYPRFEPFGGALGEYNGKFMCNQMVLRGGSCATSVTHIRRTYRNFFPPSARWQLAGIRLAQSS